MKRTIKQLILTAFAVACVACGDDANVLVTGYGDVAIRVEVDPSVTEVGDATPVELPAPTLDDVMLVAEAQDGYRKTWANLAEYEAGIGKLPVGDYTLSAAWQASEEGVGKVAYYGESRAQVYDSRTTNVDLTCSVASAIVTRSIDVPTLADVRLRVKSDAGGYVEWTAADNGFAGVNPGAVGAELLLVDEQNRQVAVRPLTFDATAAHHYHVTVVESDGAMTISTADGVSATLPLDEPLFSDAGPVFSTEMKAVSAVEGTATCRFGVTASSGLKRLTLSIGRRDSRASILSESDVLADYGAEGDTHVDVDLAGVLSQLVCVDGQPTGYVVTAQAEDSYGRVAVSPLTVDVEIRPVTLAIRPVGEFDMDARQVWLTVEYNGRDFENEVNFEVSNTASEWEPLPVQSVERISDKLYRVSIEPSTSLQESRVRAVAGAVCSEPVTLRRQIPPYTIDFGEDNIWSSKVDLYVEAERAESVVRYLKVYISEADDEWHPAVTEVVPEEHRITVSTLMPATNYSMVVTADGKDEQTFSFVTESALTLPNPSFEDDLKETVKIGSINCGGKYSNVSSWYPLYNTTSILVREAKGWASVNAKTCSRYAECSNTWFRVPSTEIVEVSHDGAYGVRLRNVAWDLHGVEPPRDTRTDNEYYSRNVPTIANRSAGKVFLGTYTFNADGTETYSEGIAFRSRPTAVGGYYRYRQDVHDASETGLVVVELLGETSAGETVIGRGEGRLSASTSFTLFKVPIVYTVRNLKATRLRLMISSSCYCSYNQADETAKIKTTDYLERGVSVGAELTLDDLRLYYE